MERELMDELIRWGEHRNRKPLLLYGARQTGKTWLLEEYGRRVYDDVVTVDFMLDDRARTLFAHDLDPRRIIAALEIQIGRRIDPEHTLVIFDEIQEAPRALTALKYFCEQAREYHIAAAGSYMGIALRREGESFPVGKVDMLTLRPMSFREFVRSRAGEPLADALRRADFTLLINAEDNLNELLREYFIVGGMPEVVASYIAGGDLTEVRRLQRSILADYEADFAKHAPMRIVERMRLVWESLAGQLARENKKFIYGAVRPGARAKDFEESLQWLTDYGAVRKVPRVAVLRVPLASYASTSGFKLFGLDVGLLSAQSHLAPSAVLEGSALFTEFKGALTEQYVLQELLVQGFEPWYWSSETGTAEVDFAIEAANTVISVEVKAGENLRSKSLKVACEKFGLNRALRTSLSRYRDEGRLVNIPLWAIGSAATILG